MVLLAKFHQYIGAIRHNCLYSEYNGAAMLAAPIIAFTEMFAMCDVYSVYLVWNGAANRKIL
jgi:hypothetical protein